MDTIITLPTATTTTTVTTSPACDIITSTAKNIELNITNYSSGQEEKFDRVALSPLSSSSSVSSNSSSLASPITLSVVLNEAQEAQKDQQPYQRIKNKRKNFNPRYSAVFNSSAETISGASELQVDAGAGEERSTADRSGVAKAMESGNNAEQFSEDDATVGIPARESEITKSLAAINSSRLYRNIPHLGSHAIFKPNEDDSLPISQDVPQPSSVTSATLTNDSTNHQHSLNQMEMLQKASSFNLASTHSPSTSQPTPTNAGQADAHLIDAKLHEFAIKTMQELLHIYGLSISPADIIEAFKKQQQQEQIQVDQQNLLHQQLQQLQMQPQHPDQQQQQHQLEPPTPPRTPIQSLTLNQQNPNHHQHPYHSLSGLSSISSQSMAMNLNTKLSGDSGLASAVGGGSRDDGDNSVISNLINNRNNNNNNINIINNNKSINSDEECYNKSFSISRLLPLSVVNAKAVKNNSVDHLNSMDGNVMKERNVGSSKRINMLSDMDEAEELADDEYVRGDRENIVLNRIGGHHDENDADNDDDDEEDESGDEDNDVSNSDHGRLGNNSSPLSLSKRHLRKRRNRRNRRQRMHSIEGGSTDADSQCNRRRSKHSNTNANSNNNNTISNNNNISNNKNSADIKEDPDDSDAGGGCGTLDSNTDGSFDSRISMKNVETLLDKSSSSMGGFYSPSFFFSSLQGADPNEKQLAVEFGKLLTRYSSSLECQSEQCRMEHNIREHYHCYDLQCAGKSLNKKEEIIRHLKWHKKRHESLNHGFLRFSSSDDCSIQFPDVMPKCPHNRKQTHYHCLQGNCDKIYISTSDVQMHSNYHRKDSAIIQEGFQRFRATEECLVEYCAFYGQRTTHFHCRRDECKYTFKNKADMEKHKTYHIKDEQLVRDGFKKFFKNETCPYTNCRFSTICNHIHCVRDNCEYVLHSSSQLLSHKRKHERLDTETAYRRHKLLKTSTSTSFLPTTRTSTLTPDIVMSGSSSPCDLSINNFNNQRQTQQLQQQQQSQLKQFNFLLQFNKSEQQQQQQPQQQSNELNYPQSLCKYFSDSCTKQSSQPLNLINRGDEYKKQQTKSLIECQVENASPHLHCLINNCKMVLSNSPKAMDLHLKMHANPDLLLNSIRNNENFNEIENHDGEDTDANEHNEENEDDGPYYNNEDDDYGAAVDDDMNDTSNNLMQITSIDGFFNRKRGRPPKNRVVEVYNNAQQPPQAIFTSFKLEKSDKTGGNSNAANVAPAASTIPSTATTSVVRAGPNPGNSIEQKVHIQSGDSNCIYDTECTYNHELHFHCNFASNCFFSTKYHDMMVDHLQQFHTKIKILDNFHYYDYSYNCRVYNCILNRSTSHYHCVKCSLTITMPSDMLEHNCAKTIKRESTSRKNDGSLSDAESFKDNSGVDRHNAGYGSTSMKSAPKKEMASSNKCLSNKKNDNNNNQDEDKVSVVRAVGTFFPANSDVDSSQTTNSQLLGQISEKTINPVPTAAAASSAEKGKLCQRAFCKLKKKAHKHCDLCNQAFSDEMKMKTHYMKHRTTKLGNLKDTKSQKSNAIEPIEHPQLPGHSHHDLLLQTAVAHAQLTKQHQQQTAKPYFSLDDLQLAQLTFYQSNPYYLHPNIYPFLNAASGFKPSSISGGNDDVGGVNVAGITGAILNTNERLLQQHHHQQQQQQFLMQQQQKQQEVTATVTATTSNKQLHQKHNVMKDVPSGIVNNKSSNKRKLEVNYELVNKKTLKLSNYKSNSNTNSNLNSSNSITINDNSDNLNLSIVAAAAAANRLQQQQQQQQLLKTPSNFKMFKDEPIPTGYLKFRFNEDCNFPNCGYRNHQSHFHCCRIDCYYSFCDKTRFVQHTARHERLDKLMGDDFRQYRASMKCGFDDCVYNKNLGPNNKSSHFHCLKCNYICSDTNKVVAHRRQHNKMEYIRMAGFRKVANNEKCFAGVGASGGNTTPNVSHDNEDAVDEDDDTRMTNSTSSPGPPKSGTPAPTTSADMANLSATPPPAHSGSNQSRASNLTKSVDLSVTQAATNNLEECSYSLKQTHYHCLICDMAVLSRAQLASHRHRV